MTSKHHSGLQLTPPFCGASAVSGPASQIRVAAYRQASQSQMGALVRAQGGWGARPTGPPCCFAPRERRPFELLVEVDLLLQDHVNTLRQFLRDQGAGHRQRFLPLPALVPAADLGVVLDRPHRGVTEGQLQVPVPFLAPGAVPERPRAVGRAGRQATVGPEMMDRGKPRDAVHLEIDREGGEPPAAGDPEQPLDIGRLEQRRLDQLFELVNLLRQEGDLARMHRRQRLVEPGQVGHAGDIELLEQPIHTVLATGAALDQPEPAAEHIAGAAERVGDHVRFGNEPGPQELTQSPGIHGIGLHLGIRDGLHELRMSHPEVNAFAAEHVPDPIPASRGFHDGLVRARKLGEVLPPAGRLVRDRGMAHHVATFGERGQNGGPAVLIDASVKHGWLHAGDTGSYKDSCLEASQIPQITAGLSPIEPAMLKIQPLARVRLSCEHELPNLHSGVRSILHRERSVQIPLSFCGICGSLPRYSRKTRKN